MKQSAPQLPCQRNVEDRASFFFLMPSGVVLVQATCPAGVLGVGNGVQVLVNLEKLDLKLARSGLGDVFSFPSPCMNTPFPQGGAVVRLFFLSGHRCIWLCGTLLPGNELP